MERILSRALSFFAVAVLGAACSEIGSAERPLRLQLVATGDPELARLRLETLVEYVESCASMELHGEEGRFHIEGVLAGDSAALRAALADGAADLVPLLPEVFRELGGGQDGGPRALLAEIPGPSETAALWVLRPMAPDDPARQEQLEGALRAGLLELASSREGREILEGLLDIGGFTLVEAKVDADSTPP